MLIDSTAFLVFVLAALALLVTPGPAVLYIVARSIDQGRIAGIVSALGIGVGTFFHIAAAALGVSAILVSSAVAFNVLKYLGAAYLIYLGVRKLMERDTDELAAARAPRSLSRVFWDGVLVNLLNPKTALFFFAFLPQFVDVARGSVAAQIVVLGLTFIALGVVSDGAYALLAGTLGGWLRRNRRVLRAQRYFAGGVYITLGVATALSGSRKAG